MRLTVIAVGRARGSLGSAVREYEERAGRYWKLEVVEVDEGAGGDAAPDRARGAEAERILARVLADAEVWALSRSGKGATSRGLARYLESRAVGGGDVVFVLGGAHGLDPTVLERADRILSLSPMTLPHDLARLVLAEQLYRAGTIRRSEPYHKGS